MILSGVLSLFTKSLWIDEGYSNLTALLISHRGIPLYDSGYFDGSYLFFHFLQAGVFAVFGYSDVISRLLPFTFGIAALALVYLVGREIFDRRVGAAAAALSALSYPYLIAITQARYYAVLIFLYLLGIWLIARFMRRRNWASFFPALAAALFGAFFHVYLYALIGLLVFAALYVLGSRLLDRSLDLGPRALMPLIFAATGIVIFALALAFINSGATPSSVANTLVYVRFDYSERYAGFFWSEFGIVFAGVFAAFAIWYRFMRPAVALMLLLSFFGPYLAISKWVYMYAERYAYFLIPIAILLAAAFFFWLFDRSERTWWRYGVSALAFLLVAATMHLWPAHSGTWTAGDGYAPEPDFRRAYEFIRSRPDLATLPVVSSYPPMDELYLGRSDGYLYIDESGMGLSPEKNFYVRGGKNIFTLAPVLLQPADLGESVILLDQLALARLHGTPIL
jgi:hypothetical protein